MQKQYSLRQSKHICKAHKANLAKELAFLCTGHTLLFGATQTEEKHERKTWVLPKCST